MNPFVQMVQRARAPRKHGLRGIPYYEAQAGGVGSALQYGPGHAYRSGSLGSAMQRGQGHAFREGSLGAALSFSNDNLIFLAIGGILGVVAVKQGWVKKGFLGT